MSAVAGNYAMTAAMTRALMIGEAAMTRAVMNH